MRIRTVSVFPPKKPDQSPTVPPISIATSAAAKPTMSETRAPAITSESMSAPPSSVPSQCALDGGS